jgi:hypothetical protein
VLDGYLILIYQRN